MNLHSLIILLVAGRGAVSACGLPELFIADHCQVKLNAILCAVDIFLMQHTMREVYYIEIATFRSANICPYLHGCMVQEPPPPLPPPNVRNNYVQEGPAQVGFFKSPHRIYI
jgi:hypothetical protein